MTQPPAPQDVFGHVTDAGTADPGHPAPELPGWARTDVATDFPALDDVLDGSVGVAGTFRDTPASKPSPVRRLVGAGGQVVGTQGRRAVGLARRRPTGVFARRRTLVLAAGLALVAGVGAGAVVDAVAGGEPTAAVTVAAVPPEQCAAAQVAWARAAAAQARMDLEAPQTVRSGFLGARDALTRQVAPAGVTAEWAVVTDYVTTVADAVADADDDAVEALALTAIADLDTQSMTTASERITGYLGADCSA